MIDRKEYTAADLKSIEFDESIYESVDLSRATFKRNLQDAAVLARDFTRTMVTNSLPDSIAYTILYGCSYDGNPLVEDEGHFPMTTTMPRLQPAPRTMSPKDCGGMGSYLNGSMSL